MYPYYSQSDEIDTGPLPVPAGSTIVVVRVHAFEVTSLEDYPPFKPCWIAATPSPFAVFGTCQFDSRIINADYGTLL